jgi:hypothetical protein
VWSPYYNNLFCSIISNFSDTSYKTMTVCHHINSIRSRADPHIWLEHVDYQNYEACASWRWLFYGPMLQKLTDVSHRPDEEAVNTSAMSAHFCETVSCNIPESWNLATCLIFSTCHHLPETVYWTSLFCMCSTAALYFELVETAPILANAFPGFPQYLKTNFGKQGMIISFHNHINSLFTTMFPFDSIL